MTRPAGSRDREKREVESGAVEYSGLGFTGRLMFAWVVVLRVILIQFGEFTAYDRFQSYRALYLGAEPALVFWVVLGAEVLSVILTGRLVLSVIPCSTEKLRWRSGAIGLPVAYAGITIFNYAFAKVLEGFHAGTLAKA